MHAIHNDLISCIAAVKQSKLAIWFSSFSGAVEFDTQHFILSYSNNVVLPSMKAILAAKIVTASK